MAAHEDATGIRAAAAAPILRRVMAALVAGLVVCSVPRAAQARQEVFASAEQAADAFVEALSTSDEAAMRRVLGDDYRKILPLEDTDRDDVDRFLSAWSKSHRIEQDGADRAVLAVGDDDWELPVPIVKQGAGWRFDTRAGRDEILTRRIGKNELSAMQVALAYYDAQKEYAEQDRNGDGILEYAQKFLSTPGKHDGLSWATGPDEPESPFGPLPAEVTPEGAYHGYDYRILTAQGPHAPGGAYDYLVRGRMIAGFALVAWPARWGETGVMTFLVSHDGKLYEKDLGPRTAEIARAMSRFDPDGSWRVVQPPE
ncbi:MAG TPA: DUF2950 domain-containing protein [Myxococcota bacterium]|nr:DUF2950 domain-containing protein [Myxococcota bacterium]